MAKKMLIDATHPEQTRVGVVSGNRLEEFDFESSARKQLKGNIYLAKVIRIEPSLQAAFVEYGGNRHGFLAFSEIHHDYYRIPVADRQALQEALSYEREERERRQAQEDQPYGDLPLENDALGDEANENSAEAPFLDEAIEESHIAQSALPPAVSFTSYTPSGPMLDPFGEENGHFDTAPATAGTAPMSDFEATSSLADVLPDFANAGAEGLSGEEDAGGEATPVDMVGGDEVEGHREHRRRRFVRRYKIQEVIKRGQIMLIQVVKEERGNKGAALTTYLSLAGRYCVLMPNTDKGGGISRKITSMQDRRRMKDLLEDLEVPQGMAVILRTAGMERSKIEVRRDLEYLMRLWENIRDMTMKSIAPCLIYEEADLIKRAIRDLYSPDIDSIQVEGDDGYRKARDFMQMLMPGHARRVHHYRDHVIPLFFRYQVEGQINALHSPTVNLRSGGYIVINQAEALVAIDVNSGRSTRERNIEETAYRTNLEAAEEIARQLRLRDLAGLIVIDFIDMEDNRNNNAVERRLKDAMRHDRARLQIGRISHFGLLELSRQRLRPSLLDLNFEKCPHCHGTGHIRLVESSALLALHAMEEEGIRQNASEITISMPTNVSMYILNNKREAMASIEKRYGFLINIRTREDVIPPDFPIERIRPKKPNEQLPINQMITDQQIFEQMDREAEGVEGSPDDAAPFLGGSDDLAEGEMPADNSGSAFAGDIYGGSRGPAGAEGEEDRRNRRRRGRRGGRNRRGGERSGEPRTGDRPPRFNDNYTAPVNGVEAVAGEFVAAGLPEGGDNFGNTAGQPQEGRQERRDNRGSEGRGDNRGDRGGRNRRGGRGGDRRDGRRDGGGGGRDRRFDRGPRDGQPRDGQPRDGQPRDFQPRDGQPRDFQQRDFQPRDAGHVNVPPPVVHAPPAYQAPLSVFDLDTTPREGGSGPQSGPPEKPKTGWWKRLTGAS
jgi:ribonuclease E